MLIPKPTIFTMWKVKVSACLCLVPILQEHHHFSTQIVFLFPLKNQSMMLSFPQMNSSHFPNHDSLIMHILVMLVSDQKNINLTSFDNLILFLHVFTELLFASFFTSFLDARQLLLVLLGILRTCVGISWKKYCKRKKKMWKKWKKIRKKGQKKERKKDMKKRLDKRCGFFQIRLWCWKTSFSLILI